MPHRQHPEQQTVSFNYAPSFIIKMALFPKNEKPKLISEKFYFWYFAKQKVCLNLFPTTTKKNKKYF